MGSTPEFRKAFIARLKQACDESKLIPKPGHGRQQMIADRLQLGAEVVRNHLHNKIRGLKCRSSNRSPMPRAA